MRQLLAGAFQIRLFCLLLFVGAGDVVQAAQEEKGGSLSSAAPLLESRGKGADGKGLTPVGKRGEESHRQEGRRLRSGKNLPDKLTSDPLQVLDDSGLVVQGEKPPSPMGSIQDKKKARERNNDDVQQPSPPEASVSTEVSSSEPEGEESVDKTVEPSTSVPEVEDLPEGDQELPSDSANLNAGDNTLPGTASAPEPANNEPSPVEESAAEQEPLVKESVDEPVKKEAAAAATKDVAPEDNIVEPVVAAITSEHRNSGKDSVHSEEHGVNQKPSEVDRGIIYEPGMEDDLEPTGVKYDLRNESSFGSEWYSCEDKFFTRPIRLRPEGVDDQIMHVVLFSEDEKNALDERHTNIYLQIYTIPADAEDQRVYSPDHQRFDVKLRYEQKDKERNDELGKLNFRLATMGNVLRAQVDQSAISVPLQKMFPMLKRDNFRELVNVAVGEGPSLFARARDVADTDVEAQITGLYRDKLIAAVKKAGVKTFVSYLKAGDFHEQLWEALTGDGVDYLESPRNLMIDNLTADYTVLDLEGSDNPVLYNEEISTLQLAPNPYNQLTSSPELFLQVDALAEDSPVGLFVTVDMDALKHRVESLIALEGEKGREAVKRSSMLDPESFMAATDVVPFLRVVSKGDDGSVLALHRGQWETVVKSTPLPIQDEGEIRGSLPPIELPEDSYEDIIRDSADKDESFIAAWDDEVDDDDYEVDDEVDDELTGMPPSQAPVPQTPQFWKWWKPLSWSWGTILRPWKWF